MSRPTGPVPVAVAAAADLLCVVLFTIGGRSSHDEHNTVVGVLTTAWPFLTGAALGWVLVALLAGRPRDDERADGHKPLGRAAATRERLSSIGRVVPAGAIVAGASWAAGMLLRHLSGQGTSGAFPLVALGFLVATLLGWRAVAALVSRRAPRRSSVREP